jgi:hypothetical protein
MAVAQARIGEGQAIEAARSQQLPLLNSSRSSHAKHSASCGPAVEGPPQSRTAVGITWVEDARAEQWVKR